MELSTLLILIWLHFVADFILQSDWMARNKSSSNIALAVHVCVYSIPFILIGWVYACVNGVVHFGVDWITSRLCAKLYKSGKRHEFFVVLGLDQAIHMTTLVITYQYLIGGA